MIEKLKYKAKNLHKIDTSQFGIKGSELYMYLDNLDDNLLQGNKMRKLYGAINHALENNNDTIVSVGGNYSNYIYALSHIPKLYDINVHILIKGHEPKTYGHTLKKLQENEVTISFVPHSQWKNNSENIKNDVLSQFSNPLWIDEGGRSGYSDLGFKFLIRGDFDFADKLCVSVGTGSTCNAIAKYWDKKLLGFVASNDIFQNSDKIKYIKEYNFGGFAKMTDELFGFVQKFKESNNILLDPIYTSKMMYGIMEMYKNKELSISERIVAIHTGGLQGWYGIGERHKKYKKSNY